MGKLHLFEVVFEGNDSDVFASGQFVRGHVKIILRESKDDVRGISIKFLGKSHCHWTEGSGNSQSYFHNNETYFKEKITCWGKDKNDPGASRQVLESGEHRFPFAFQIPNTPLPFPLESCVGWIRYKVACKIDRPWKFNHTTERLFTVTGIPVDLNTMPQARYPSRLESSKTVCCLCCTDGPILTKASTDKSAYVIGETAFVSGTVENKSRRQIIDLTAKLMQKITYISTSGHKTRRTKTLSKDKGPGCRSGEMARMDWKPLLVPPVPPTGPQGCNIMKIEYFVEFEGNVSGTLLDAEVKVPITIGTVPLYQGMAYSNPPGVMTGQPLASADAAPPPSYEFAMGGQQEIPSKSGHDYTFGKLMYAPQYPTYNMPIQAPTWDPMNPPSAPVYRPS